MKKAGSFNGKAKKSLLAEAMQEAAATPQNDFNLLIDDEENISQFEAGEFTLVKKSKSINIDERPINSPMGVHKTFYKKSRFTQILTIKTASDKIDKGISNNNFV